MSPLNEPIAETRPSAATAPAILVAPCDRAAFGFVGAEAGCVLLDGDAFPPPVLLGLAAASDAGAEAMARARARLARDHAVAADPVERFDLPAQQAACLGWVARRLASLHRQGARRNVGLMAAMAAIREEHEETQAAFRKLESYVAALPQSHRSRALALDPLGPTVRLSPGTGLEQRLPLGSPGLSDIAIHIAGPIPAAGRLMVGVRALSGDPDPASWALACTDLRPGWVRLALGRALGTEGRSLGLRLDWTGEAPLALSLSLPHPDPEWNAQGAQGPLDRVLALRAWTGLPGLRSAQEAPSLRQEAAPDAIDWHIGQEALAAAEALGPRRGGVIPLPGRDALQVTPVDGAPTLARLARVCPAGMRHVRAWAMTDRPDAPLVEYALAVRPAEGAAPGVLPAQGLSSPWVRLGPSAPAQVHLLLPEPLTAPADLYLGTRFAPGGAVADCNALFWDIRASVEWPGAGAGRP